jgi:hypothetical protein
VPDAAVARICRIARDFRAPEAPSLAALIDAAEYRAVRRRLTVPMVALCISADPDLVADWLAFSEDKRTTGGWAFEAQRRGPLGRRQWKVWQPFPEGETRPLRRYDRAETACAEYVLAELDYWAAIGDQRDALNA